MILGSAYDNPQNMDDQHRFALAFLQQQQQHMNAAAMHSAADHAAAVNMHAGASAAAGWGHLQPPPQASAAGSLADQGPEAALGTVGTSGILSEETRKRQLQEILQQIMTITEQSLDAAQARFDQNFQLNCFFL